MSNAALIAFMPGPFEMVVILIVAVLLFGKRLPEVGKSVGQGIKNFKSGISGIETEINEAAKRPARSRRDDDEDREEATAPKFEPPQETPVG